MTSVMSSCTELKKNNILNYQELNSHLFFSPELWEVSPHAAMHMVSLGLNIGRDGADLVHVYMVRSTCSLGKEHILTGS